MKRVISLEYNGKYETITFDSKKSNSTNDAIIYCDSKKFKEYKVCDLKPRISKTFSISENEIKFKIKEGK